MTDMNEIEIQFTADAIRPELDDEDPILDHWTNNPDFKHGVSVGESFGLYEAQRQALRAHQMGEIELWLQYVVPKTMEDWNAWDAQYGADFSNRWGGEPDAQK